MPEAEGPVVWGDFEVRLDRLLGRGGMGSVYEARQVSLDRKVAVKVLDTDRAPTEDLAAGFLEKFQHEARALAKINDPRIVTILQAGRADGKCWYAMELVEGQTVDQRITDQGALEPREAARVAAEVARALAAALAQNIIHRDVKPANIFLTADGRVKLGDFGLARSGGFKPTRFTEMNAVAGTPEYASPEQAANGTCDHRSDQYSLGAVLFEMVTERPPFGGANAIETFFKHAHEPPPLPTRLNPAVPPALETVILRCLEKDPARRYPGYDEFIRDLESLRETSPNSVPETPPAADRPTLAIRTAAIAAIVLVGFSIWGASRIFSKGPEVAPSKPPPPVVVVKEVPPPPPAPPPAPAPVEQAPPKESEFNEGAALKAAWDACERGDGVALSAYLEKKADPQLQDELDGIRDPFAHPTTKAFERAIGELYADRPQKREPLGEIKQWKIYPEAPKGTRKSTPNGFLLSDKIEKTWMSREFAGARGFSIEFRFAPESNASFAGVAITPMSPKSFRMLHLLQAEGGLVASIVDTRDGKAVGHGERPIEARETHEFAVVERQGRFACFVDGEFMTWEEAPGFGGWISICAYRAEIEVTEIRIAR